MSKPTPAKKPQLNESEEEENNADTDDDNDSDDEQEISEETKGKNLKSFLHGITYQQKLLLITLLSGISHNDDFSLNTEEEIADKFDDVVYNRYINNHPIITFLQAKHSQDDSKKITYKELTSKESKEKFNLGKYFLSSLAINKNYKDATVEKLVICSNIDLSEICLKEQKIHIKRIDENFFNKKEFVLYKLVQENIEEKCPAALVEHLTNASELSQLADYLVRLCLKPKTLTLKSYLFKRYHILLFSGKVLQVASDGKCVIFHPEFYDESRIGEIFFEMFKSIYEKNGKKMVDLKKVNFLKEKKFGVNFFVTFFELNELQCDDFINVIISLMNKREEYPLYRKRSRGDNLFGFVEKLAGLILFTGKNTNKTKDVVTFGASFCDDKQDTNGDNDPIKDQVLKFKDAFKKKLFQCNKTLDDLKMFKFRICNYLTCFEEVLPYDSFIDAKNDKVHIEDFLKKLHFLKTPKDDDLVKVINAHLKTEILTKRYYDVDFSRAFMNEYIINWMKGKYERALNKNDAADVIEEMKQKIAMLEFAGTNSRYCGKLKDRSITFNEANLESNEIQEKIRTFLNKSTKSQTCLLKTDFCLFGALRIQQILERKERDNFVFDNAAHLNENFENLQFFMRSKKAVNIIIAVCKDEEFFDVLSLLKNARSNKKIIIISKNGENSDFDAVIDDTTSVEHFCPNSIQELITKRKVFFQGKSNKLPLHDLLNNNLKLLDNETLFTLIKNKQLLEVGIPPEEYIGYDKNYFIKRNYCRNIAFDVNIFNESTSDWFIVESETYPWHEKKENIKNVFSLANVPMSFNNKTTHFFKKKGEKLIWQKSLGSIRFLLQQKCGPTSIMDDLFYNEPLTIIANVAGMEKSTSLILKCKEIYPSKWVIRINVSKYRSQFDSEITPEEILNVMLSKEFQSKFDKNLFEYKCSQKKVLIVFDGYDEIDFVHREKLKDVINILKTANASLWITTRTNLQRLLEQYYNVFSLSLEPLNESQQLEFLLKYWKMNYKKELTETKNERMKMYAETIVEKFCQEIKDSINSFGTIPLQLKMLADFFQDNKDDNEEWDKCYDFIEKEADEDPHLPETLNLYNLYKMFVDQKIKKIYLKEKHGVYANDIAARYIKDKSQELELLALKRLLREDNLRSALTEDEYKKLDEIMKYTDNGADGIINGIENNEVNFIHLTFGEYFAATALANKLLLNISTTKNEDLFKIIDALVLTTSSVFVTCISKLFSTNLEESKKVLNGKSLATYAFTQNFIYLFKALVLHGFENSTPSDINDKTPLHYVAENGDLELLEFLKLYHDDILEKEIIIHGHFIKPEYEFSKLVKYINQEDASGKSAIFYAQQNGHMECVCHLLLYGSDTLQLKHCLNDIASFVTSQTHCAYANQDHVYRPIVELLLLHVPDAVKDYDTGYNFPRLLSYLFLHGRIEVINRILSFLNKKDKLKVLKKDDNGLTPLDRVNHSNLLTDLERLETVKYLLDNGGDVVKKQVCWSKDNCPITNILQAAARDGHLKTLKTYLDQESREKLYLHFATACQFKRYNIITFLMEKNVHIYYCGNSPLHTALDRGLNKKFINEMFLGRYNINETNEKGETPLFMALKNRSGLFEIRFLVMKGADVNIESFDGTTPLKLAAENEMDNILRYFITENQVNISSNAEQVMLDYYHNASYDLNKNQNSLLKEAILKEDKILYRFIIKHGKNVNDSILHLSRNYMDVFLLLLQYGVIYSPKTPYTDESILERGLSYIDLV